jgi:putative membrane protein
MWAVMDGWGWWGWGMGIVHGLLWLAILALGIVVLVRMVGRGTDRRVVVPPVDETAIEILKKRYARGEIGKEEFEQKRRDLAT